MASALSSAVSPNKVSKTAVRAGKDAIREGEVFQVVLSQRADIACDADPLDVYRVLKTINPSPYMYLLNIPGDSGMDAPGFSIIGSSPAR